MPKINKAKAKTSRIKVKIGVKSTVKASALFALIVTLVGCTMPSSQVPSAKSQTQNNTFRDCMFVMTGKAVVSNGVVKAEGGDLPSMELFTQAQSLESSGSETFTQSPTQTPTVDVKPDIDVSVPVNKAGTAQSVGSVLGDAVASLIKGGSTSSSSESTSSAGSSSSCTDGSCSISASCSDGSCNP